MYGYIGFFFHYEPNFLPFRPKKARKWAFFVTIFSSNATSWIISNQSIVVVAPKVIKINNLRYEELKKVHEPSIFSIWTTHETLTFFSEDDNFFLETDVFGKS